jgi:hypothetical protein
MQIKSITGYVLDGALPKMINVQAKPSVVDAEEEEKLLEAELPRPPPDFRFS